MFSLVNVNRKVNPKLTTKNVSKSPQINMRQFIMSTILELSNDLVSYFMTFSFQVLRVILVKPCFTCRANLALTLIRALHHNTPKWWKNYMRAGGTLKIIVFCSNVYDMWNICWPVFDLWGSRQIDITRA